MKIYLKGGFLKESLTQLLPDPHQNVLLKCMACLNGEVFLYQTAGEREVMQICSSSCLIWHAKWEPLELPKPIQVVNLKQYRIPGGLRGEWQSGNFS